MAWNRRADGRHTARHNIVYGVRHIRFHIHRKRSARTYSRLVNDNLYWARRGKIDFNGEPFAKWQAAGFDTRSRVADPGFADPARGDFSLRPDSPALKIGFKPIDLSTVGPRRQLTWRPPDDEPES